MATVQLLQQQEIRGSALPGLAAIRQGAWIASLCRVSACRDWESELGEELTAFALERHCLQYAVSGHSNGSIVLSDLENRRVLRRTREHRFGVHGLSWFTPDNGVFASISGDKTLRVWDANVLESVCHFQFEHQVSSLAFGLSSDLFSVVAIATENRQIRLCDVATGATAHSLLGHSAKVLSLAWSPRDPTILATGAGNGELFLWDVRKARSKLAALDRFRVKADEPATSGFAHSGALNGLAWGPGGLELLSCGHDDVLRRWDVNSRVNTRTVFGPAVRNRASRSIHLEVVPHTEPPTSSFAAKSSPWPVVLYPSEDAAVEIFAIQNGDLLRRIREGVFSRVFGSLWNPRLEELYIGTSGQGVLVWGTQVPDDDSLDADAWSDYTDDSEPSSWAHVGWNEEGFLENGLL